MTADERLAAVLAVFAPCAVERLLPLAGVDPCAARALARAPRRERLAALARAAQPLAAPALADLLRAERPALHRLAAAGLGPDAGPSAATRGPAILRRLMLEQLAAR